MTTTVNQPHAPARIDWASILARAAAIVESYDTGVTLRQLFYRLVAAALLPNTTSAYKGLSKVTAEARRARAFPSLIDRTRSIHRFQSFEDAAGARAWLSRIYRRDRTAGQGVSLYLGVEKNGIVAQLEDWFSDLGVPIVALGGYSSQSYVDEIRTDVAAQDRPAILVYAGDFDASGKDIDRDFLKRTACFDSVEQIALSAEQVRAYNLPAQAGKAKDSRARAFTARYGALVQVELDALPPDQLRALYQAAIDRHWDTSAYDAAVAGEREDRRELAGGVA